ncbi:TPA: hypothetical protein ACX6RC_000749 [Photobacterium damselae]
MLLVLNEFLNIQVQSAQIDGSVNQQISKDKYEKEVLKMRKNVGFSTMLESQYWFDVRVN